MKKYGALSSSTNPEQLAATVTGVIRLVAGALVSFGLLTQVDMQGLIEQTVVMVPAGIAVYGAVEVIFGIIRKMVVGITKKY